MSHGRWSPYFVTGFCLGMLAVAPTIGWGQSNRARRVSYQPQRRTTARPTYELTEKQGPWLIFVGAFAGESAENESSQLVLELRKRWRLPAYTFREHYDYTELVPGNGIDERGRRKMMKHSLPIAYDEIAVMIGNFPACNDPKLQDTLKFIKYCRPSTLEQSISSNASTMRFAGLRSFHRRISPDKKQGTKGPLAQAFATRNPLLPEEFFAPKGLDPLVVSINKGVKYSLLKCPSKYSVRIATFRGMEVIDQREIQRLQGSSPTESKLAEAADKAHRLVEILRSRGVEAYEFHDRHESIVTVGNFESLGLPQSDGSIELYPPIHRIMQTYGASQRPLPGQPMAGLMPKTINGIMLDVQPMAVEVPRNSIARDYARSNSLWR